MKDFSGLRPGDQLRIREDLEVKDYDGCTTVREMVALAGDLVTIEELYVSRVTKKLRAKLKEFPQWCLSAEMFDIPRPSVSLADFLLGGENGG